MTEDQKQTVIEMLEGIVRMTTQDEDDTIPEWKIKAAHQQAQAALRTVQITNTTK